MDISAIFKSPRFVVAILTLSTGLFYRLRDMQQSRRLNLVGCFGGKGGFLSLSLLSLCRVLVVTHAASSQVARARQMLGKFARTRTIPTQSAITGGVVHHRQTR